MQSLLELPRSVLGVLLEFVDHHSLHQLETTCRHASATIDATDVWRTATLQRIALYMTHNDSIRTDANVTLSQTSSDWKRMACIAAMPCQRDRSLLLDVYACSSVDRPCESPTNTLEPSRCWRSMQTLSDRTLSLRLSSTNDGLPINSSSSAVDSLAEVAQIECGCETAACYWSSSPSASKAACDYIEYTVRAGCLVTAVHVLPYRAFWHPDSPTFAPQRVSFEFFAGVTTGSDRDRICVYSSPVYTMANAMQLHAFELPKRVWLAQGGTFRLNLMGRYQQETFEMPPWIPLSEQEPVEPPYYCCLSYVNAVGVSLDYR